VEKTAHDWVVVAGKLVGGAVASVVYGPRMRGQGRGWRCEITGTEGSLVLEVEGGMGHIHHPSVSRRTPRYES
jgi:hypothetical protein